jgi:hypothetical protein
MGVSGRVGRREAPVRTNENLSINGLAKRTKTGRGVAEGITFPQHRGLRVTINEIDQSTDGGDHRSGN